MSLRDTAPQAGPLCGLWHRLGPGAPDPRAHGWRLTPAWCCREHTQAPGLGPCSAVCYPLLGTAVGPAGAQGGHAAVSFLNLGFGGEVRAPFRRVCPKSWCLTAARAHARSKDPRESSQTPGQHWPQPLVSIVEQPGAQRGSRAILRCGVPLQRPHSPQPSGATLAPVGALTTLGSALGHLVCGRGVRSLPLTTRQLSWGPSGWRQGLWDLLEGAAGGWASSVVDTAQTPWPTGQSSTAGQPEGSSAWVPGSPPRSPPRSLWEDGSQCPLYIQLLPPGTWDPSGRGALPGPH